MPCGRKPDERGSRVLWRQKNSTIRAALIALGFGLSVVFAQLGAGSADADPGPLAATPDQVALATLDDIVRGDQSRVTARFDDVMTQKLSAEALGEAWAGYQQLFGPYQSHGDPEDVIRGDITVVNVPLQMQHGLGQFRLSLRPDGTIAGLFFLREGVPVP